MPALPFRNLPATRQEPMDILKNRYDQTERYLRSQYDNELNSLQSQTLADKDFHNQLNTLNTKYGGALNQERFKVDQQVQSIQRIQTLVESGQIAADAGQEAMWRLVLPSETERAMFQEAGRPTGRPFSPSAQREHAETIDKYVGQIPRPGLWWTRARKEPREPKDLIQYYMNWQREVGYGGLNFWQQGQLDDYWDRKMLQNNQDAWWSDKGKHKPIAEIRALRTPGKMGKIMKRRMVHPGGVTPLGESIEKAKPRTYERRLSAVYGGKPTQTLMGADLTVPQKTIRQRNRRTGEQRISYDGGKTWRTL